MATFEAPGMYPPPSSRPNASAWMFTRHSALGINRPEALATEQKDVQCFQ
jgi:hypothetical protein